MERGSKAYISNIFEMAYCVKMKLPGDHEMDVQLTERQNVYATTAINTAVTTTTNMTLTV